MQPVAFALLLPLSLTFICHTHSIPRGLIIAPGESGNATSLTAERGHWQVHGDEDGLRAGGDQDGWQGYVHGGRVQRNRRGGRLLQQAQGRWVGRCPPLLAGAPSGVRVLVCVCACFAWLDVESVVGREDQSAQDSAQHVVGREDQSAGTRHCTA